MQSWVQPTKEAVPSGVCVGKRVQGLQIGFASTLSSSRHHRSQQRLVVLHMPLRRACRVCVCCFGAAM